MRKSTIGLLLLLAVVLFIFHLQMTRHSEKMCTNDATWQPYCKEWVK